MTAGLCDWCGHSAIHYSHTECTPEAEAAREACDHSPDECDLYCPSTESRERIWT